MSLYYQPIPHALNQNLQYVPMSNKFLKIKSNFQSLQGALNNMIKTFKQTKRTRLYESIHYLGLSRGVFSFLKGTSYYCDAGLWNLVIKVSSRILRNNRKWFYPFLVVYIYWLKVNPNMFTTSNNKVFSTFFGKSIN